MSKQIHEATRTFSEEASIAISSPSISIDQFKENES
jgi:hypothetical protein